MVRSLYFPDSRIEAIFSIKTRWCTFDILGDMDARRRARAISSGFKVIISLKCRMSALQTNGIQVYKWYSPAVMHEDEGKRKMITRFNVTITITHSLQHYAAHHFKVQNAKRITHRHRDSPILTAVAVCMALLEDLKRLQIKLPRRFTKVLTCPLQSRQALVQPFSPSAWEILPNFLPKGSPFCCISSTCAIFSSSILSPGLVFQGLGPPLLNNLSISSRDFRAVSG